MKDSGNEHKNKFPNLWSIQKTKWCAEKLWGGRKHWHELSSGAFGPAMQWVKLSWSDCNNQNSTNSQRVCPTYPSFKGFEKFVKFFMVINQGERT